MISISLTHPATPTKERDQVPLREATIRQAEPRLKSYKISDSGGLYVSIQPDGSKLWRFKYRYEGVENILSFGPHPGVSLADARGKKRRARRLLEADQDPRLELSLKAARQTFEAATLLWHDNRKIRSIRRTLRV